jgi:heme-degrading monooxygenase HmoA
MFGRVSTFEGSPDQVDDLSRYAREQVLPALEGLDGFSGALALADRRSGKVLAVTFWESEEAMRASEDAATQLRDATAEAASETITGVERYEVTFAEIKGAQL